MDSKRKDIIEQVKNLYLEFGIKSVTMDDISHKLGISKKTLYEFFTDKKQLVWSVLENINELPIQPYSDVIPKNMNALDELLFYHNIQMKMIENHKPGFMYDLKKYYPKFFEHFHKVKRQRFLEKVRANLRNGKKEGLFRPDLNEEIITQLTLMRMECLMSTDIFKDSPFTQAQLFDEIFRFHLYGIVSEKGRKMLEENIDKLTLKN